MNDRRRGFLWEDEREVIDDPEHSDTKVEHRLRTETVDVQGLNETLRTVRGDLNRVEEFCREENRHDWADIVLPGNEQEIRRLYLLLGDWLKQAETDFVEQEQAIVDRVTEPLRVDNEQEFVARWDALVELIQNDDLRAIFEWIAENEQSKLPKDRTYGGISWRQAASSQLRSKLGMVEQWGDWDSCYVLTERGEVVYETLRNIGKDDRVKGGDIVRWWNR